MHNTHDRQMHALRSLLLCLLSVCVISQHKKDPWKPLQKQLDDWLLTANFAVTVGTVTQGKVFEYLHGNMTLDTTVQTASTSKWPIAMMFAGLVADGTIESLDVPVHTYVDWWTSDPTDLRSNVTLDHLLSFTSGFGSGGPGNIRSNAAMVSHGKVPPGLSDTGDCYGEDNYTVITCAQQLYTTKLSGPPGTVFSYDSIHLQLAAGIASTVTGLDIQKILTKYLWGPYNMSATTCDGVNPVMAVCLETTGRDYERFLYATLTHSVLPVKLVTQSEVDHTTFMDGYALYGHYGYGHWLECFDSVDGYTPECAEAQNHIDPGAFGYFPMIDRKNGYYMQIVACESGLYYPRSGIPEYLRFLIKPIIDAILQGEDVERLAASHYFTALSLSDVNYIFKCYHSPLSCL